MKQGIRVLQWVKLPRGQRGNRFRKQWGPYMYVLPAVITLALITIFPFLYSLIISFFNYDLRYANSLQFTGLQNYLDAIISDGRFHTAVVNTIRIIIPSVSLELILGLVLALALNQRIQGKRVIVTLLIIPTMIPAIVAAFIWRTLYLPGYGGLNDILARLHVPFVPTWLGDPTQAVIAVILVDVWQWTPFVMMIVLAGLQVLPEDPYESAILEGASRLQSFLYITLPQIRYHLIIAAVFRLAAGLILFDPIFVLTGGGPAGATETVAFYIYTVGFRFTRIGYAAALSYLLLLAVIITSSYLVRATNVVE